MSDGPGHAVMMPLRAIIRASEWWEYKLLPTLAIFYATAVYLDQPILPLWPAVLTLLASLIVGAIYVSVLNDVTDLKDDAAAGKVNRVSGRSPIIVFALITLPVLGGLFFLWTWREQPLLFAVYALAWVAFTLYSLPPVRLKTRGLWGLVADASGSHLCPTLLASLLVFAVAQRSPDGLWLTCVGTWAAAYGLRGILWHQVMDAESDRLAGARTFVQRHGERLARGLGLAVVFPIEILALAGLVVMTGSTGAGLALVVYGALALGRVRWFRMRAIVVSQQPQSFMVMNEYYEVFLPLFLIAGSVSHHPADLFVIIVHLAVFPGRMIQVTSDIFTIVTGVLGLLRRRLGFGRPDLP
jgi:4-hydroxybenzoate polyprenyltransferase